MELVKAQLGKLTGSDSSGNSCRILFYAVERNDPELVRVLCRAGANPNDRAERSRLPILAFTILETVNDYEDRTEAVVALLAMGADPNDLPQTWWTNFLAKPQQLDPSAIKDDWNMHWCKSAIQLILIRNFNLTQRYSCWKASRQRRLTPRGHQSFDEFGISPLKEISLHIVGQHQACEKAISRIRNHVYRHSKMPLVLLFAGPSGHGKTEFAKQIGLLLSAECLLIDCTHMRHMSDLLGPRPPFVGYEEGSPLNNFLAKVTGNRSIVFLDEFDKTTNEVQQAMLLLFESGKYRDQRDQEELDCSKVVWILATNHGQATIQKFWNENLKHLPMELQIQAPLDELYKSLDHCFIEAIGAPLTGRVTQIIPFLPFGQPEMAVAAFKFMRELSNSVRRPIDAAQKIFVGHIHLNFVDDGQIAEYIARKTYNAELGARSLQQGVRNLIEQLFLDKFLDEDEEVKDEMNKRPPVNFDVRVSRLEGVEDIIIDQHLKTTSSTN
ncbi:MAG: hypothetical protein Q9167_006543 [Letrouitia subvulpina]